MHRMQQSTKRESSQQRREKTSLPPPQDENPPEIGAGGCGLAQSTYQCIFHLPYAPTWLQGIEGVLGGSSCLGGSGIPLPPGVNPCQLKILDDAVVPASTGLVEQPVAESVQATRRGARHRKAHYAAGWGGSHHESHRCPCCHHLTRNITLFCKMDALLVIDLGSRWYASSLCR